MAALGFTDYWDGYFAGRAAPLGRAPAEVVHAPFYNFADGEVVARHVPKVWATTTPEAAHAAPAGLCGSAAQDPGRHTWGTQGVFGGLARTIGLSPHLPPIGERCRWDRCCV